MHPADKLNKKLMNELLNSPALNKGPAPRPFKVVFPNGDVHQLAFKPVATHRRAKMQADDPDGQWWDHEQPRVLAMWPLDHMPWEAVERHLTPRPRKDNYFRNSWANKKARVTYPG